MVGGLVHCCGWSVLHSYGGWSDPLLWVVCAPQLWWVVWSTVVVGGLCSSAMVGGLCSSAIVGGLCSTAMVGGLVHCCSWWSLSTFVIVVWFTFSLYV